MGVAYVIGFEGFAGQMRLNAIGLGDEALRRPQEVDRIALDQGVRHRQFQAVAPAQFHEKPLQLAPGVLESQPLAGEHRCEATAAPAPGQRGQGCLHRGKVEDPQTLSFAGRPFESPGIDHHRQVEQGPAGSRDSQPVASRDLRAG